MFDPNLGGASAGALLALPNTPFQRPLTPIEFRPFTALKKLPPEPLWLWRGYLAPGSLTDARGPPVRWKEHARRRVIAGAPPGRRFLGRPTRASTALVISEEDEGTLRQRSEILGLLELDHDYLARSTGSLSLDWPSMIKQATTYASGRGHRLLVVDTFPGLAGLAGDEENDAGAVGDRLRPLQQAAGEGLAVLFLHHMNRFGQPRGSKALSGVVDVSIRFQREKGSHRFRLNAESRSPRATPSSWRAQLVQGGARWRYEALEGSGKSGNGPPAASTDHLLLQAIEAAGPEGVTYDELGLLPGISIDMAKRRLPRWRGRRVEAHGSGRKGDPLRWHSSKESSAVQPTRKEY